MNDSLRPNEMQLVFLLAVVGRFDHLRRKYGFAVGIERGKRD